LLKCVENKRCSWRYLGSRVDVEKGTSKILKKKLYLKIEIFEEYEKCLFIKEMRFIVIDLI
jgi:predicted thioesterase